MLRALSLAILIAAAGPGVAVEPAGSPILVAQQQTAPQATPKRDCERSQEGIS
ncbi:MULTISPECIES: hypothetical protein [Microvirga]|uniref:hypothetical protein n=1 Tax=Microvirga TaxID=186650 RepID=UPI001CFFC241|nr:hypothetical protein [Microvirga lenta]MCB5176181.1 hypothetical protein [Microvirga lenta]